MALTRTTLSSACSADAKSIVLASITALAVGQPIRVDNEEMRVVEVPSAATLPVKVLRGVNGTAVAAHVSGASAIFGLPSDFVGGSPNNPQVRDFVSYSAAGAIALPSGGRDRVAVINGTSALAMTLAVPGKDNDGAILTIVGNGKAAHTVTVAGGPGAGGTGIDVLTFAVGAQQALQFVAANEVWVALPSVLAGTLTNITVTAS